ncbi:gamma-glutamyltransferase family protein [Spelaeicoccus albus]|uniref:Gamma-glutamyltranspeptidase/glutathione hydrolase n=1 Tax=Spelaeicoccus albus TaxID=1280376 RepID=A0A7Z0D2Q3_9MICO|nr:gamma-glutamyltransferase [Spelaeicoccus albus]NYI67783.1 gamma-glutamyltranspeptidase/glutathione hydrolase [Spelaeicoccus albus]
MTFTEPPEFLTRPTLKGTFGMVTSTHWLASSSAQAVLERGGNAFDAAVAGAFVLHVVEPHLNGPGGDLVAIVQAAGEQKPQVLMGQGPAPAGATIEHYAAEGLDLVPGSGALAAAVPGSFDAWLKLLADYGTWELADVWSFAIDYAESGHPVLARVCSTIERVSELFTEHWTTSADQWLPGGRLPEAGEIVTNKPWAATLRRILTEARAMADADNDGAAGDGRVRRIAAARRLWSNGFVAHEVQEFASRPHRHSSGDDHAGVITATDMSGFHADWEDAVSIEFRGYTIWKSAAWGQGPVLLQALKILDGLDDDCLDPSTAKGAHHILEALKLAFADRDAYYGDTDVPLDVLLSEKYAATRRALISGDASLDFRPGHIDGARAFTPPLTTEADLTGAAGAAGEPTVPGARPEVDKTVAGAVDEQGGELGVEASGSTRGDTCHLDIVDTWGNMISATPSGGWLQSSPYIPSLGFSLGTRLQMTWLLDGAPTSLTPGKRPRTTLTPTLVSRGSKPVIAVGSPGGDQQEQWQLLYLLRVLVGGYTHQAAIDAPAFHTTSMPGSFWPRTWTPGGAVVEDRLGDDVIGDLERRGHVVTRAGDWALGRLSAVSRNPDTGLLKAGANPRGMQGYAVGR